MSIFKRVLRSGEGRKLRALEALVPDINALEPEIEALSDDALRAKTGEFRAQLDQGAAVDDLLIDAFAVVREAAKRVLGQRHYDVQLVGGAALHLGWVAEMKTGEGKTLTSTLPIYLNGVTGKGVHVVTVNDYLASRDADWMGQVHRWLGLDVGLILPGNRDSAHKREQYAADVTYGTNNEFGFDYLRDNMAMSRDKQVQRGHHYCIVDEIDSILIDEARTPLIISGRVADARQALHEVRQHRPRPAARSPLRGRRGEAHGRPARGGRARGREGTRHREPVRPGGRQPRPPAPGRAAGQGALPQGPRLHRGQRRGEDRRRVHRSHPRWSALVRGSAPGGGGQGGGGDQGGEPDPRNHHAPELLPALRAPGGQ